MAGCLLIWYKGYVDLADRPRHRRGVRDPRAPRPGRARRHYVGQALQRRPGRARRPARPLRRRTAAVGPGRGVLGRSGGPHRSPDRARRVSARRRAQQPLRRPRVRASGTYAPRPCHRHRPREQHALRHRRVRTRRAGPALRRRRLSRRSPLSAAEAAPGWRPPAARHTQDAARTALRMALHAGTTAARTAS